MKRNEIKKRRYKGPGIFWKRVPVFIFVMAWPCFLQAQTKTYTFKGVDDKAVALRMLYTTLSGKLPTGNNPHFVSEFKLSENKFSLLIGAPGAPTPVLTIDGANTNVGIGTTNPQAELELSKGPCVEPEVALRLTTKETTGPGSITTNSFELKNDGSFHISHIDTNQIERNLMTLSVSSDSLPSVVMDIGTPDNDLLEAGLQLTRRLPIFLPPSSIVTITNIFRIVNRGNLLIGSVDEEGQFNSLMTVTESGPVGIGIDQPETTLHLFGEGGNGTGTRIAFGDNDITYVRNVLIGEYDDGSGTLDSDQMHIHGKIRDYFNYRRGWLREL